MSQYAVVADVYLVFGRANVLEWANLDNDEPTEEELQPRIDAAIVDASAFVDNRLRGRGYSEFTEPYDRELTRIVAVKAGLILYQPRAGEDVDDEGNPTHKLKAYDDMVKDFIRQVRRGEIVLPGRAKFTTVPMVVVED